MLNTINVYSMTELIEMDCGHDECWVKRNPNDEKEYCGKCVYKDDKKNAELPLNDDGTNTERSMG